ncbi:hypothetical protein BOTBODRAFT_29596 [Botryobasidium botryosum FD-172 SS1]|uniref:NAD-P-binding protein n=1 Tax=Botryobasidium botryosum (strain FD-172 SS1) TaxID=930990 RepID=A0A067MU75_BOTB1|nr:hypothetical protein BOTBODRAFT_29596 [Botryobasidium botryosum FD-172 SS1]
MASQKPILVVAGIGNGTGTGAATAREFAKKGYRVALIARNAEHLEKAALDIRNDGGEAQAFPASEYSYAEIHRVFEEVKKQWPNDQTRVSVWNVGFAVWKPFLETTEEEVKESVNTNIVAAFAFAKESILAFKGQGLDENGARGTLIFTSATAAWRGNITTSAVSAGKHGLKALAQSLNKEFGKQNIHVAHAIIDGVILTDRYKSARPVELHGNEDVRLNPESIAKAYVYLAQQDRSAWTFELDLRPAHEKW